MKSFTGCRITSRLSLIKRLKPLLGQPVRVLTLAETFSGLVNEVSPKFLQVGKHVFRLFRQLPLMSVFLKPSAHSRGSASKYQSFFGSKSSERSKGALSASRNNSLNLNRSCQKTLRDGLFRLDAPS